MLVPNSFGGRWFCMDPPRAVAVLYPARGVADEPDERAPDGLDRLVGRSRATVLRAVDAPASTTHLVEPLRLSIGADRAGVRHTRGRRRAGRRFFQDGPGRIGA